MKIKCPHCKRSFSHTPAFHRLGGRNRWKGVTHSDRSAMARKAWVTKRKKMAALDKTKTTTQSQNANTCKTPPRKA